MSYLTSRNCSEVGLIHFSASSYFQCLGCCRQPWSLNGNLSQDRSCGFQCQEHPVTCLALPLHYHSRLIPTTVVPYLPSHCLDQILRQCPITLVSPACGCQNEPALSLTFPQRASPWTASRWDGSVSCGLGPRPLATDNKAPQILAPSFSSFCVSNTFTYHSATSSAAWQIPAPLAGFSSGTVSSADSYSGLTPSITLSASSCSAKALLCFVETFV